MRCSLREARSASLAIKLKLHPDSKQKKGWSLLIFPALGVFGVVITLSGMTHGTII